MDKQNDSQEPAEPALVAVEEEESPLDLDETNEITQRGHSVLELSKELTSSSKALLEQI